MTLDFVLLGSLALGFYGLTYFLFRRRTHALHKMLLELRKPRTQAGQSFLMRWAFRGRGIRQERLAHLFTAFPPLMSLVTAAGLILVFLAAIAFLKVATSIGALVTVLLLAFPFYRATDAFDMYFISRVADRAGLDNLSDEDETLLETAEETLANSVQYFGRLSLFTLLVLPSVSIFEPVADRFLGGLIPQLTGPFLSFAGLILAVLASTLATPRVSVSHTKTESDQTPEVGAPLAWDHLAYGTVPHLDATRSRLMKKFRPSETDEKE